MFLCKDLACVWIWFCIVSVLLFQQRLCEEGLVRKRSEQQLLRWASASEHVAGFPLTAVSLCEQKRHDDDDDDAVTGCETCRKQRCSISYSENPESTFSSEIQKPAEFDRNKHLFTDWLFPGTDTDHLRLHSGAFHTHTTVFWKQQPTKNQSGLWCSTGFCSGCSAFIYL